MANSKTLPEIILNTRQGKYQDSILYSPKPILINPSFLKKCSLFFLGPCPHHLRVLPHLCSIEESPSQKAWTWDAAVTSFRWGWRADFGSLDQNGSTTLKLTVLTLSLLALSIEIISALHCSALKLTVPQYLLWSIEINSLHALCMSTEIICSAITPVQCNWNYLWYHCDIVISLKIIWDYLSHGWHCPLKLPVSTHCVTLWHCVTLKVFVSARCVYTLCLHIGKYPSNAVQNLRRAKIICASAIENICNNLWLWDRSKSPKIFVTVLTLFTGNNLWQALWRTFPCNLVSL